MKTFEIAIRDGFVWAVIDEETAGTLFNDVAIYRLYNDSSDALCEHEEDLITDFGDTVSLGIELGNEAELKSDWQEACARNNETRSFEAWLEDKAESIIY